MDLEQLLSATNAKCQTLSPSFSLITGICLEDILPSPGQRETVLEKMTRHSYSHWSTHTPFLPQNLFLPIHSMPFKQPVRTVSFLVRVILLFMETQTPTKPVESIFLISIQTPLTKEKCSLQTQNILQQKNLKCILLKQSNTQYSKSHSNYLINLQDHMKIL